MIKRPCSAPGCFIATAERYCTKHKEYHEKRRPSSYKRGYGAKWRKLRKIILWEYPFCQGFIKGVSGKPYQCNEPAQEVDHIIPLSSGGTNEHDNLQSLCKSCHSRKTIQEQREAEGRGV